MRLLDVVTAPCAIQPEKLLEIQAIYATHLRGEKIDIEAVEKRLGRPLNNEPRGYDVIDGVAVLPIHGVIAKRANLFSQISGGVSSELVARDFRAALMTRPSKPSSCRSIRPVAPSTARKTSLR